MGAGGRDDVVQAEVHDHLTVVIQGMADDSGRQRKTGGHVIAERGP